MADNRSACLQRLSGLEGTLAGPVPCQTSFYYLIIRPKNRSVHAQNQPKARRLAALKVFSLILQLILFFPPWQHFGFRFLEVSPEYVGLWDFLKAPSFRGPL